MHIRKLQCLGTVNQIALAIISVNFEFSIIVRINPQHIEWGSPGCRSYPAWRTLD
jgi:hypothetical protein